MSDDKYTPDELIYIAGRAHKIILSHIFDDGTSDYFNAKRTIPSEIADRVRANAEIVGKAKIRDQILIVLNDYRNHAWAPKILRGQPGRIVIADMILEPEQR